MKRPDPQRTNLDQLPVPESWDEHWEHDAPRHPGFTWRQWLGLVAGVSVVGFLAGLIAAALS